MPEAVKTEVEKIPEIVVKEVPKDSAPDAKDDQKQEIEDVGIKSDKKEDTKETVEGGGELVGKEENKIVENAEDTKEGVEEDKKKESVDDKVKSEGELNTQEAENSQPTNQEAENSQPTNQEAENSQPTNQEAENSQPTTEEATKQVSGEETTSHNDKTENKEKDDKIDSDRVDDSVETEKTRNKSDDEKLEAEKVNNSQMETEISSNEVDKKEAEKEPSETEETSKKDKAAGIDESGAKGGENVENKAEVRDEMEVEKASEGEGEGGEEEKEGSVNPADTKAGRSKEADPEKVEQLTQLMERAAAHTKSCEHFDAADLYGQACEIAGQLYGDLAPENALLYYLYGSAMLECAKNESPVLGEAVKPTVDEEESEEGEEDGADDGEENGDEKMEVVENGEGEKMENGEDEKPACNGNQETGSEEKEETKEEEEEEETLKTAWEMLELAKVIYKNLGDDMKLSDTYIKLGEVGMETGHETAINDMKYALELRLKCAPEDDRLLAETHFNIGLAYTSFQKYDDAMESFSVSKSIIERRLEKLKGEEQTDKVQLEVKELSGVLPELEDKIQDMKDAKEGEKKEENDKSDGDKREVAAGGSTETEKKKPASNISHLVKRKRKIEEVAGDLPNSKQPCTEAQQVPTKPELEVVVEEPAK